jgi:hypothetical protein
MRYLCYPQLHNAYANLYYFVNTKIVNYVPKSNPCNNLYILCICKSNRTKSCIQDVVYSFLFFKLIFSIDAEMVKSK